MQRFIVGAAAAPADLQSKVLAWMDLRRSAPDAVGAAAALIGCLLNRQQAANARQSGVLMVRCSVLPDELAAARILEVATEPDVFAHYGQLESRVSGLPDPADALASLAQLCLCSTWPLAENAWIWLDRCARQWSEPSGLAQIAWRLLQLRLSTLPALRSPLAAALAQASPVAVEWQAVFAIAWDQPWADGGWVLPMTRQLCSRDDDAAMIPLLRWLAEIGSARQSDFAPLEELLARRNINLLLNGAGFERARFQLALNVAYRELLRSSDEERVRWGVQWAERLGGLERETAERLVHLSGGCSEALRRAAAWAAFRGCWDLDFRLYILRENHLDEKQRAQIACSPDPDSDWIGYVDVHTSQWLVDPERLQRDLCCAVVARQREALHWLTVCPFPALEDAVLALAPSCLRDQVLELYRWRSLPPNDPGPLAG